MRKGVRVVMTPHPLQAENPAGAQAAWAAAFASFLRTLGSR